MNRREAGFSLVELMITLVVFALVVSAIIVVMATSTRSKQATEGMVEAQQSTRSSLEILSRDIRCAGFGVDKDASPAQPAFAYVDSQEIMIYSDEQPGRLTWNPATSSYVSVAYGSANYGSAGAMSRSDTSSIQAPAPTGTPLPPKLTGAYTVPAKWSTGAELIRYTLDLNDDGVVDAFDQSSAVATDVQRTVNPNDFLLVRRVYGDKSGSVPTAGNNGGAIEKVGVVRKPGGTVPAMFTVYIGSNPTPWDWASGPVPAGSLNNISRIVVNLTSEARSPDKNGTYARAQMTTEVNSIRNVPEAGNTVYTIDGYVYDDKNKSLSKDAGDVGIANVVVRLGTAGVAQTNASGYYTIAAAPASYTLRQEIPAGYGPFGPDTSLVTLIANTSHSFADTAKAGGWLYDTVFVDTDNDKFKDPGEYGLDGASISAGGQTVTTNSAGGAQIFLPPGSFAVTCTVPDSFTVTSTNPQSITMVNGSTARADFAVVQGADGTVQGKVYKDLNKNSAWDSGEPGLSNVWVAVTKSSGTIVQSFAYTDANGDYSITVPANDPPHTTAYEVTYQIPTNYYAVSTTMITGVWVQPGQTITGKNFGANTYQVISLTADRVLSLGSAELMEKDWSGNDDAYDTKAHKDVDLILGSEYVSAPNISVWFNQWNNSTLFNATPDYQRNAQSSALSMAIGTLDAGTEPRRPDVVTGLKSYATGNIAVWLTQNTSGNFGFLPTPTPTFYKTTDGGDVNAVVLSTFDTGTSLDLIVGTRTSDNAGTIEIWTNNGSGVFSHQETYPTGAGFGSGSLGQVKAMALGDFDKDGDVDLAVVTRTNYLAGKLHIIERTGNTNGSRFNLKRTYDLTGEGNALVITDVDGDTYPDIIVGTHTAVNGGKLEFWRNDGSGGLSFTNSRTVDAPGIVLSLGTADYGGISRNDLAMGFVDSETSNAGGVRIYILDSGTLPTSGTDPSSGTGASYMTTAITVNNFNNGDNPLGTGTQFTDLAVAQKPTPTTGQVIIFIR